MTGVAHDSVKATEVRQVDHLLSLDVVLEEIKHDIIATKGEDASILCHAVLVAIALDAKLTGAHSVTHIPCIGVENDTV